MNILTHGDTGAVDARGDESLDLVEGWHNKSFIRL
jgi:hypothetical protein